MASILITGSSDGLGRLAAQALLAGGHDVIVHARNLARLSACQDLLDAGARGVHGDLSDQDEVRGIAEQVNRLGQPGSVIHNAGVLDGPVLSVNVVAPYLLTALLPDAGRHVYLSSSMHRGGSPKIDRYDFAHPDAASYSDSKFLVTALMLALARLRLDILANAVDPGWVPTKMGGTGAPDDLDDGWRTQAWLAAGPDAAAHGSGGYWHHRRRQDPHPQTADAGVQDELLVKLAEHTGVGW